MIYRHRFQVRAPLARVAEFHRRSASMAQITPPLLVVRVHSAPPVLVEGDQMDFTLWLGPLPVHWLARIEQVSPNGFTDRQVRGPFADWVHRHTFIPVNVQNTEVVTTEVATTEVVDEVSFRLRRHWFWGAVGWAMQAGLPALFAFRAWKTKRMLE